MKKIIRVVGAVIVRDESILCAQRSAAGQLPWLWEFPGGKIESGESPQEALVREIYEELRCDISVGEMVTTTTHEYEFAIIELQTYFCVLNQGNPLSHEHENLIWLTPQALTSLEWAPADIPAVEIIQRKFLSQ